MPETVTRVLLTCLLSAFGLYACQEDVDEPQNTSITEPVNLASSEIDGIPYGQLPSDVTPTAYQLILTIDPELDGFSGKAIIDMDIAGSRNHFYLHGKDITANKVQLSDGTRTINAVYEQVDESGIVKISSPESLQGEVRLEIEYSAPFNPALRGFYAGNP